MRFPWQKAELPTRKVVAEEFIACIFTLRPGTKLKRYSEESIDVEFPDGSGCVFTLHKVHAAVQQLRDPKQEARFRTYLEYLSTMLQNVDDQAADESIGPKDQHRVLPRLMYPEFLDHVAQHAPGLTVPRRAFYETGLIVVYVLDSEQRVAYIMAPQAEELGLDETGLYGKSLENACKIFPQADFRSRLAALQNPVGDGCPDGHNSARAILVPEYLEPGESLALLLPDKDTFVWGPPPADNNWNPLRELLKRAQPPYIRQPMLATAGNVRMM